MTTWILDVHSTRFFCASAGVGRLRGGNTERCLRAVVGNRKERRLVSSSSPSQNVGEHTQRSDDGARTQDQTSVEDARNPSNTSATAPTGSAKLFADAFREETSSESVTANASGDRSTSSPTGSDKLFADALLEESSSTSSSPTNSNRNRTAQLLAQHTQQHENWSGEESMQDAVLRMLVDKYKPLRGPVIRSAEEKLRERPPSVRPGPVSSSSSSSSATSKEDEREGWSMRERRAMEPLLPSKEGHRPWHTTFTPPSTLTPRVKLGSYVSGQGKRRDGEGTSGARRDIAAARRSATAQRLGRARESMIDYKLGLSPSSSSSSSQSSQTQTQTQTQRPRRPAPAVLKAWASLIEERIERARQEGQFTSLKGRGQPIRRASEETNPFIAREEFLMNRIVQRNQAAPPWVELQGELESAIQTFRTILRQAWTKRAVLALTSDASRSPSSLLSLTLTSAQQLRDPAWAAREASYHASALGEVNELVRRYNGVAPYSVRKPYFEREKELERCYVESAGDVVEGVRERVRKGTLGRGAVHGGGFGDEEDGGGGRGGSGGGEERREGVWEVVRTWIASLRA
ncbi:hypothetical protein ACEPAG_6669 [Sanghuangporus baumii]